MTKKYWEIGAYANLWHYLHHYATERAQYIERLSGLVAEKNRLEGLNNDSYDAQFLNKYFDADDKKDDWQDKIVDKYQ